MPLWKNKQVSLQSRPLETVAGARSLACWWLGATRGWWTQRPAIWGASVEGGGRRDLQKEGLAKEDSSAQERGHWTRLRGTQRPRRAAGQGATHTLRTQPPAVQGEVRRAERVCAEGSGRAALGPPTFCLDLHTALHTLPWSRDKRSPGPRALLRLCSQHRSPVGSRPNGQQA